MHVGVAGGGRSCCCVQPLLLYAGIAALGCSNLMALALRIITAAAAGSLRLHLGCLHACFASADCRASYGGKSDPLARPGLCSQHLQDFPD